MSDAIFVTHSQAIERAYRAAERSAEEDRQQGQEAFSSWGKRGYFWSTEDYNLPGFQEPYIKNNFVPRARAMFEILQSLAGEAPLSTCTARQELLALDFSGGPACLADGTAQFLKEKQDLASCTMKILDPVLRWNIAIDYLNEQYSKIDFEFQQKPDLLEMAASEDVACANIVTIGSALVDFLEKERVTEFWESIARQVISKDSQLIVFVFDRFKMNEWLVSLPDVQPRSLGEKQGGLFPYAVYINMQRLVPRALRDASMPAPTTPLPTRRQGLPTTPDAVSGSRYSLPSSSSEGGNVWIAPTGRKFHRETCDKKGNRARPVSRSEAVSKNLTPCLVCRP